MRKKYSKTDSTRSLKTKNSATSRKNHRRPWWKTTGALAQRKLIDTRLRLCYYNQRLHEPRRAFLLHRSRLLRRRGTVDAQTVDEQVAGNREEIQKESMFEFLKRRRKSKVTTPSRASSVLDPEEKNQNRGALPVLCEVTPNLQPSSRLNMLAHEKPSNYTFADSCSFPG